jgi:hypothetical protein
MTLLEIIDQIEAGRKAARVFPFHATSLDIIRLHGKQEEVSAELNRLYTGGIIKVGDTVNDKYVHVAGRNYDE